MSTLKLAWGVDGLADRSRSRGVRVHVRVPTRLLTRGGTFALLITLAAGGLRAAPAHAERKEAPLNLALATPPPTRPMVLAETPRAAADDDAPTATPAPKAPWWPWVLIAVAAAGIGALVFTSSGKDPSCPAG